MLRKVFYVVMVSLIFLFGVVSIFVSLLISPTIAAFIALSLIGVTVFFIRSKYKVKYFIWFIFCLAIAYIFMFIPAKKCGSSIKDGVVASCDCLGIIRYKQLGFEHECLGFIKSCYVYRPAPLGQKVEIPCN